jgi:opacity protein-like surface antigen
MSKSIRRLSGIVLATASLAMGAHAQAQSGNSTMPNEMNASGSSWYAPAGGRYIGLNAGRSDFPGSGKGDAYSLYMGGMMNQNLGLEFGATDFGNSGGRDAYGFSLSAVGRIPLTPAFSLFGKLGGLYSRTENHSGNKDHGWGETYGAGVDFNVTQNLTAVLQYDRSRVKFSGDKEHINTTSVGLKYRY